MPLNHDSIERALAIHGTSLTVRHYTGTTPQYDDNQNPLNSFDDISQIAMRLAPSKSDIFHSGGLVTNNDRKLIFHAGGTVEVGDDILISGGTHRVFSVDIEISKKVAFIRGEQNA